MLITRVSKGTPHDIYNSFISDANEIIQWSDWIEFTPDSNFSFYKDIKDDFIV
jgi:hypothetical protein